MPDTSFPDGLSLVLSFQPGIKADVSLGPLPVSVQETDPTVPAWAKNPVKPAYTAAEVTGAAAKVIGATAGNFAALNASGNPTDSGKKPGDFANAVHNHAAGEIVTGALPIERGGTGANTATGALANLGSIPLAGRNVVADLNSIFNDIITKPVTNALNLPSFLSANNCTVLQFASSASSYAAQLAFGFGSDYLAIRRKNNASSWGDWVKVKSGYADQAYGGDWLTPTLLNSWTQETNCPVRYCKDAAGFVHLNGRLTNGSANAAFTLPTGYKPLVENTFVAQKTNSPGAVARVSISASGTLYATTLAAGEFVDLSGITFKAEA